MSNEEKQQFINAGYNKALKDIASKFDHLQLDVNLYEFDYLPHAAQGAILESKCRPFNMDRVLSTLCPPDVEDVIIEPLDTE